MFASQNCSTSDIWIAITVLTVSLASWACFPQARLLHNSSSMKARDLNNGMIATYLLIDLTDLMLCSVLERHGVGRILEDLCEVA